MLLKNVKTINKNHIIFENRGNYYYESIDNDNKLNIFNENLMNIFLEQFEENIGIITYNDIVQISTLQNHDVNITNLPNKLKTLNIMSTMCKNIQFNGEVCSNIESITIDKSNIHTFPDIRNCTKLKILKINHSCIGSFNLNYDLPDSLSELNLQTNIISNTKSNFSYDKLLDKINKKTLKRINLSDNFLDYDRFPENLRLKCNLIRQNTYVHNIINFGNVANFNVNNFVNQANIQDNQINLETTTKFFSSQNVHLSSINSSVLRSVEAMKKYVSENEIKITVIDTASLNNKSIASRIYDIFNNANNNNNECADKFMYYYNKYLYKINFLKRDFDLPTINSITNMTYKSLFELIWSILFFKHKKDMLNLDDAFERIMVETIEGKDLCFTGKFNRLVNSTIGFIDGVQVGFSEGEQLQLEFGVIIKKLNKDNYTFEKLYCDTKEILHYVNDENTQKAWFDAIMDLAPAPENLKYGNREYLKTWDHDILDIRTKEIVGYYEEKEEQNGEKPFIIFLSNFE
jgi:hypothetical protein